MTEPRFTVKWYCPHCHQLVGNKSGYAVYDRDNRITITFREYGEAIQHRDNIAKLYARWGFV